MHTNEERLSALKAKKEALSKTVEHLTQERAQTTIQHTQERQQAKATLYPLTEKQKQLEKTKKNNTKKRVKKAEKITTLQKQELSLSTANEALKHSIENTQQSLSMLGNTLTALKDKISQLTQEAIDNHQRTLLIQQKEQSSKQEEVIEQELDTTSTALTQAQTTLQHLKTQKQKLITTNDEKIKKLSETNNQLAKNIKALKIQCAQLTATDQATTQTISTLLAQTAHANQSNFEMDAQYTRDLQGFHNILNAMIARLQSQASPALYYQYQQPAYTPIPQSVSAAVSVHSTSSLTK